MNGRCQRETRRRARAQADRGTPLGGGVGGTWISKLSTWRTTPPRPLLVTGRSRLVVTSPTSSRVTRAAHSPYGLRSPTVSVSHVNGCEPWTEGRHYARTRLSGRPRAVGAGPGHYTDSCVRRKKPVVRR